MKLVMPRSFTDHPLSRKVEHLKCENIVNAQNKNVTQVRVLSEDENLRDSEVQLMCV